MRMLPDGARLGHVVDCLVAKRNTLLQLVVKLLEAEYLQLIARKYLADGGGDEAMVNIVVAGLKSVVIITSSSLSWLLLGVA